jgi:uncharacterized protein YbjT (DUF2867 family)
MKIAIAGATGFIGRRLIERLRESADLIGLTRRPQADGPNLTWRSCELFSLRQVEEALAGADVAVYLIHSMLPPARLTQGRFEDLDLLLADNFGRAAAKVGVKRIIYLGGLVPETDAPSRHLASRHEVESALAAHGVPVVALRAGIVIGAGGSSFEMVERLVRRLPAMICPQWTRTLTHPVAASDAVEVLARTCLDPALAAGDYDMAGRDRLSYLELMQATARHLGLWRPMFPVLMFSPQLSRLWLSLITGAPKQLVGPLVESLRHPLQARDHRIFERYGLVPQSVDEALVAALAHPGSAQPSPPRLQAMHRQGRQEVNVVCSVQRLPLPPGETAAGIARRYADWLRGRLAPLIEIGAPEDGSLNFRLRLPGSPAWDLLVLTPAQERSDRHRHLFYITGGALVRKGYLGRFEFRTVPGGDHVLAAVYDFVPALPWWLYRWTQAVLHLVVMGLFKRHLAGVR